MIDRLNHLDEGHWIRSLAAEFRLEGKRRIRCGVEIAAAAGQVSISASPVAYVLCPLFTL